MLVGRVRTSMTPTAEAAERPQRRRCAEQAAHGQGAVARDQLLLTEGLSAGMSEASVDGHDGARAIRDEAGTLGEAGCPPASTDSGALDATAVPVPDSDEDDRL